MRIAVTGATGFVGRHFVEHALAASHAVSALHRPESGKKQALVRELQARGVELHAGDVADRASLQPALRGPTASAISPRRSAKPASPTTIFSR